MNTFVKLLFSLLLAFFVIHLLRDILQIYNIDTPLATLLRTNHLWCRPFCDYATLPHEIFGIIGSSIVLKRKKVGILGWLVLLSLPLWSIGFVMEGLGLNR
ncbi:MAG: hypothetical protein AAB553_05125 [Patescibacteria group bacterium]